MEDLQPPVVGRQLDAAQRLNTICCPEWVSRFLGILVWGSLLLRKPPSLLIVPPAPAIAMTPVQQGRLSPVYFSDHFRLGGPHHLQD